MRKLLPLLLLITATTALAQVRTRATVPPKPDLSANTVSGTVSAVAGPLVQITGGLVTIDTTGASIVGDPLAPGALVYAVLKTGDVAANAPLPASYILVTHVPQASLTGAVTAVDVANSTVTLLGRTIKVTPQTAISSAFPTFKAPTLSDIVPRQIINVEANASGGALVATAIRILALSTPPALPTLVHGTVKSIAADSWVINANGKDVVAKINAQTKISGSPAVGDTVDVLLDGDGVAIAILKLSLSLHLTGFVRSIEPTRWTVGLGPSGSLAPDFLVLVNAQTKITGNPRVGDRVEVVGEPSADGIRATSITKL